MRSIRAKELLNSMGTLSIPSKRFVTALGIIILMGILIVGADRFMTMSISSNEISANENNVSRLLQASSKGEVDLTSDGILSHIEQLGDLDLVKSLERPVGEFPTTEIAIPENARQFRYDPSTSIFSFSIEGSSRDSLEYLTELWARQDWCAVPLVGLCGATFMKEEGEYRWMMVTCAEVGTDTCVVVNPLHV